MPKNNHKKKEKEEENVDISGICGKEVLNQSQSREGKIFVNVSEISKNLVGKSVLIRARIHTSRLQGGNLCFLVLRQKISSIQVVVAKSKTIPKQALSFIASISKESIVDVEGQVTAAPEKIESTTQHDVEIKLTKLFIVSESIPELPIQIEDCSRPKHLFQQQAKQLDDLNKKIEDLTKKLETDKSVEKELETLKKEKEFMKKFVKVSRKTKLDFRSIDLRTQANHAIFTVQSGVCTLFREFLLANKFMEIHTPKLIGCASEGGADVFKLGYFETYAFLAQSPQLYKQMAIISDFERVFEIGSVFRSEKSFTHRHLTEFIGLDIEMSFNEHYYEVLDVLDALMISIFDGLNSRFKSELETINKQFPFRPLNYHYPSLRLQYPIAMQMLRDAGEKVDDFADLTTPQEKLLGKLVYEKYNTDFFILDKFPTDVRPFYTMPNSENPKYTNSYDFILRGEEICSGAQRIHDYNLLIQRAKAKGVAIDTIKDYVDSFKYGAPPHAGCGLGLERIVMLFCGLKNIRSTSLFPRDPTRLTP